MPEIKKAAWFESLSPEEQQNILAKEHDENETDLKREREYGRGPKNVIDSQIAPVTAAVERAHKEAIEEDKIRTIIKQTKERLQTKIDEGKK